MLDCMDGFDGRLKRKVEVGVGVVLAGPAAGGGGSYVSDLPVS